MKIALFAALGALLSGGFMSCAKKVVPDPTLQVVVGVADTAHSSVIELHTFERVDSNSPWGRVGRPRAANIGRRGLAVGRGIVFFEAEGYPLKREGDGRSPAGVFRISAPYGYGDGLKNATPDNPVTEISGTFHCVEDVRSPRYNQVLDTATVPKDWKGAQVMRRPDGLFSRLLVVGHNGALDGDVIKHCGSCIFFHVERGPGMPTAGCTSLPAAGMDELIRWLRPAKQPVYVLATRDAYAALSKNPQTKLPSLH